MDIPPSVEESLDYDGGEDGDDETTTTTTTNDPLPSPPSTNTNTTSTSVSTNNNSLILILHMKQEIRALKTLLYRKDINLTVCLKEQHAMRAVFEERILNITESLKVADDDKCGERGEDGQVSKKEAAEDDKCRIFFWLVSALLLASILFNICVVVVQRYPCAACARCSLHCARCHDLVRGTLAESSRLGACMRHQGQEDDDNAFSVRMSRLAAAEEERRRLEDCIANVEAVVHEVCTINCQVLYSRISYSYKCFFACLAFRLHGSDPEDDESTIIVLDSTHYLSGHVPTASDDDASSVHHSLATCHPVPCRHPRQEPAAYQEQEEGEEKGQRPPPGELRWEAKAGRGGGGGVRDEGGDLGLSVYVFRVIFRVFSFLRFVFMCRVIVCNKRCV